MLKNLNTDSFVCMQAQYTTKLFGICVSCLPYVYVSVRGLYVCVSVKVCEVCVYESVWRYIKRARVCACTCVCLCVCVCVCVCVRVCAWVFFGPRNLIFLAQGSLGVKDFFFLFDMSILAPLGQFFRSFSFFPSLSLVILLCRLQVIPIDFQK